MLTTSTIESLAVQLVVPEFRKESLLLLGPGFAQQPGVPSTGSIARSTFVTMAKADPERARKHIPIGLLEQLEESESDDMDLLLPFYRLIRDMRPIERASLFGYYYQNCETPPAYRVVVDYIRQRRFRLVFMTYLDMFLSEVLDRTGLRKGIDYLIIDPVFDKLWATRSNSNELRATVPLVRLYGELVDDEVKIIFKIVSDLAPQHRCVAVGYDFGNPQVNECLAQPVGDLWWIDRDLAISGAVTKIDNARTCYNIDFAGDFFVALSEEVARLSLQGTQSEELLRDLRGRIEKTPTKKGAAPVAKNTTPGRGGPSVLKVIPLERPISRHVPGRPATSQVDETSGAQSVLLEDSAQIGSSKSARQFTARKNESPVELKHPPWKDMAWLNNAKQGGVEATYLRNPEPLSKAILVKHQQITMLRQQLRSAQEILATMEQRQRLRGIEHAGQEAEVNRQRAVIAGFERQLLTSASHYVVPLIDAIAREAVQLADPSSAATFFSTMAKTVAEAYANEADADVIAATIYGTVYLAQRLESVDQQKVRELESFLPGGVLGGRS